MKEEDEVGAEVPKPAAERGGENIAECEQEVVGEDDDIRKEGD